MNKPVENICIMNSEELLFFASTAKAQNEYQQNKIAELEAELKERYEVTLSLNAELLNRNSELLEANAKYQDLIMAVVNKYPNETRHETAKRLIMEDINPNNICRQAKGQAND